MRHTSVVILGLWATNIYSFSPLQNELLRTRRTTALKVGGGLSPIANPADPSNENTHHSSQSVFDFEARQLLGIKDAAENKEKWKIWLQLLKPITWVPLSLVAMCGAAASGNYQWIWHPFLEKDMLLGIEDALKGLTVAVLAGPFSVGFAQAISDWYDHEIDAINEPHQHIPSGAIAKKEVFQQLWFLFFGGLALAMALDKWAMHNFPTITVIALYGYLVSYVYLVPPLKPKQNGWTSALAIGTCYISLQWWCGQSMFGSPETPFDWFL